MNPTPPRRALVLHGGWEGHHPEATADFAERELLVGFEVTRSASLDSLRPEVLAGFDLLLPIWTFGSLAPAQEEALLDAVARGLGLVAWHGAASAFLPNRLHKLLLGGQFVAHPGGEAVEYEIRFAGTDPLTRDLAPHRVRTEQYYLLVDPAVTPLATTVMAGDERTWLRGVTMPVAWKRPWGLGRVFYLALGHSPEALRAPSPFTLLQRAVDWARRGSPLPF